MKKICISTPEFLSVFFNSSIFHISIGLLLIWCVNYVLVYFEKKKYGHIVLKNCGSKMDKVFGRWDFSLNSPSINANLWFRSIWIVLGFTFIFIFLVKFIGNTKNEISSNHTKIYLGLIVTIIATRWALDTIYARKWLYVAALFNDAVKSKSTLEENVLDAYVAIDILRLDLWANKSFQSQLIMVLKNAVEEFPDKAVNLGEHFLTELKKDSKSNFKDFPIDKGHALILLGEYADMCKDKHRKNINNPSI